MTAQLLKGKEKAEELQQAMTAEIEAFIKNGFRQPTLAVILIGEDPASALYVKNKHKACQAVGIMPKSFYFDNAITESELLRLIETLNQDATIDGILIQLPLPSHINQDKILENIQPNKDVDGFHPYNLGRLAQRRPHLRPCTPYGIILLLEAYGLHLQGLNACIVGISNIVGRPMIFELLMAGATPTACHRLTQNLSQVVSTADVLIVAAGVPHLIQGDWVKPGAIVVDVGIHRLKDGTWRGDVEYDSAKKRAGWITPVPGGVGPMTVAVLLKNTLQAYKINLNLDQNLDQKNEMV